MIAFNDKPEQMQIFTSDVQSLEKRNRPHHAHRLQNKTGDGISVGRGLVGSYIAEPNQPNPRPEVWLYSDGRASDAANLRLQGDLKYQTHRHRHR